MKSKKNRITFKKNRRTNKNKVLAEIALILLLIVGVVSSLILINQKQDNRQQASFTGGALISFKKIAPSPANTIVSVPVYLNSQDIELDQLNLKINVTGDIKNLSLKVDQKAPVKKIAEKIEAKSAFISLSSSQANTGWSTNNDVEILTISFTKEKDGEVWLSFDPKETIAKSSASDENIITIGNDLAIKIGAIAPTEVKQIQKETNNDDSKKIAEINNNLLVGMIASSSLAAIMTALYVSKSHKKEKFDQEFRTAT